LLPRTWIALLHGRVRSAPRGHDGVRDAADEAECRLAGADVVMTASALLRHGPEHATVMIDGLSDWMARKGFTAVDQVPALLAVLSHTDGAAYERARYVNALRAVNAGSTVPGDARLPARCRSSVARPQPSVEARIDGAVSR
jgi:dihydroorotate dehydrogenase (fumarate)